MTITATSPPPQTTGIVPHRFSVEDFGKMIEQGLFDDKTPVELIEGLVAKKMTHNPAHDGSLTNVLELIRNLLPTGWHLRPQMAVTLSSSQPLPDLCVVRGHRRSYFNTQPGPADIGLLVEVSDSTLAFDSGTKLQMYARDSIVEYWIVNIPDRQIEVYTQPSGPAATPNYAQRQIYPAGSQVPLALDGVVLGTIAVDEMLP